MQTPSSISSNIAFPSIPDEVQNLIYSQLPLNDMAALRQASKAQHENIAKIATDRSKIEQRFKDRFGALASHEKTVPVIESLARRFHQLHELSQAKPTHILKFENGVPILVEPETLKKISWWQQIKGRYFQWRLESPDENVNKEIRKIFNEHIKVLNDLFTRPLDKERPLQDYRDRMMRRQTILEERCFIINLLGSPETRIKRKEILENYWTTKTRVQNRNTVFREKYPFKDWLPFQIEHIAFFIFFIFHRIFSPTFYSLSLPRYSDSKLFIKSRFIEIGKTTILLEKKPIHVKIFATPQIESYELGVEVNGFVRPPQLGWSINLLDENVNRIAEILIKRTWKSKKLVQEVYEDFYCNPENDILSDPALVFTITDTMSEENSQTGDLPIERAVTQLAVELFNREPDKKLKIVNNSRRSIESAFIMGGFKGNSKKLESFTKLCREEIVKNRQIKNKLFEGLYVNSNREWVLCKGINSFLNSETKFCGSNSDESKPAYVEYKMDGSKSTWERTITEQPLLNSNLVGPLLPKFWERDLSKQMALPEEN